MTVQTNQQIASGAPYALPAGEGQALTWFTSQLTLKASSPDLGLVEGVIVAGEEPPMHVHRHEDEWLYVLDGDVTFHVGGESHRMGAGGFVFFPRAVPHTFTVESESARLLVINTPGGFERMFELGPTTVEEAGAALAAFGMDVVGPNPREGRGS